jgi:ribosomal protein S27E
MQNVIISLICRCNEILATPTGGKLEMRDGVHIRRKAE